MAKKKQIYDYDYDEDYEEYEDGSGAKKKVSAVKIILITLIALLLVLAIAFGVLIGVNSCSNSNVSDYDKYDTTEHKTNTLVGTYGEVVGNTDRKPAEEVKDYSLPTGYPEYGKSLDGVLGLDAESIAKRNAIVGEANYLAATGTWNAGEGGGYVWMDKDGYLYNGTTANPEKAMDKANPSVQRKLFKHSASVGLYDGNVSDSEPAVIKKITLRDKGYNGYSVTGIYAPAGEVIKIEISKADMEATGGIVVHIGQALYNGKANNIWVSDEGTGNRMNRFPVLLNTMKVNKDTSVYDEETGIYTAYVGSFLGGPLYIRNSNATFTVTISGGVNYRHFILGSTTEQEFEELSKSTAPYFDLEIWNYGILFSGPVKYVRAKSYDDLYKVAVLWDKIASVTTTGSKQGIVFLFDPFVAAGAACAFPGQMSVNAPLSWMEATLNYEAIVTSGCWGSIHEYHHNFQGYGVGDGGEVTNNALSLVSYSLFTEISKSRAPGNYGAAGLSGWNRYTSATFALNEVKKAEPENGKKGLALYATLLHNFGQDAFIKAKVKGGGQSYQAYADAWEYVTHYNMTFYFNTMLGENITSTAPSSYPMFVPVSSFYQTGRAYTYDGDKIYINTMTPYMIPSGENFILDLNPYVDGNAGSVVLPEGFTYKIKSFTKPEHGGLYETTDKNLYRYEPDEKELRSGKFSFILEITAPNNAFKVEDVELVFELEQTQDSNKWTTERTTYTYSGSVPYKTAKEAYEQGYAGYTSVESGDNINDSLDGKVIQNCNSEVWFNSNRSDIPTNQIIEIRGKYYIDENAKYRFALRGRWSTALYLSIGSPDNFEFAAEYNQTDTKNPYFPLTDGTYVDMELERGTWVYYKAVMLLERKMSTTAFIGVGFGKYDFEDNTVETRYADSYRSDFSFDDEKVFEADYFYVRENTFDYTDNVLYKPENITAVKEKCLNLSPWATYGTDDLSILFDGVNDKGDKQSQWHTSTKPTEEKPFTLVVDMGEVCNANRVVLYSQAGRPDPCFPKDAKLYTSLDGETFTLAKTYTNLAYSGSVQKFDFDACELRYYKLEITASYSSFLILRELELWHANEVNGGSLYSLDSDMFTLSGDWQGARAQSSFGHCYVGNKNSSVKFEFTGNGLAILASKSYGHNFKVIIDGKEVASEQVKEDSAEYFVAYLLTSLTNTAHTVEIVLTGGAGIDSVATFAK